MPMSNAELEALVRKVQRSGMSDEDRRAFLQDFEDRLAEIARLPNWEELADACDRETSAAAAKLWLDMKLLGAGLHLSDDGELQQRKRPLPGYERVAERARRLGAVQFCLRCHREAIKCNCEDRQRRRGHL